jgi:hypothetical protein
LYNRTTSYLARQFIGGFFIGIMFGLLQNFEQVAGRFSPILLIGTGVILVLVGLFIWIGGLGLARILCGVVGAVAGAVCGLFAIRCTILSAAFLATVLAAFAVIFERIFFIVLTAALAAVVSLAILAWPYLGVPLQLSATNPGSVSVHGPTLSINETIEVVRVYFINLHRELKQVRSRMPLHNWVIVAAMAAVFLSIGFYLWRLTSALSCAALGTMLIFAGMVLLLLYKGSVPISSVCCKAPFYSGIFIAMTAFGTIVQLLLCRRAKKRSIRKKEAKDREEPEGARQRWRTI